MKLLSSRTQIDFMGKRFMALAFSGLLIAASIGSIATRGLEFGIDFTGGWLIEAGYPQPADLGKVRGALETHGFPDAQVQHFGSSLDVLVRVAPRATESSAELSEKVLEALRTSDPKVEMRRVEFVGPQIGGELKEQGGLAMLYALIGILIYVALRFQMRFAVGAVVAVVHDVIITVGFFSVMGLDFDLTVLAAILAVIGYSLNDTVVVFDRIRENFRRLRKKTATEVINLSINETLSRTIMTSLTTLLVLIALNYFGGEIIHAFSLALIVGVVVGTYSSIFVASTATLMLGVSKEDLMQAPKEGQAADDRP